MDQSKLLLLKAVGIVNVLFLFFSYSHVSAQDPSFSQYEANPLYLNPANTGRSFGTRFGINYRYQPAIWHKFPGPFSTANAYFDKLLCNNRLGFGINVLSDIEGEGFLNNTVLSGLVGTHVPLWGKNAKNESFGYLSGGMKFTAGNHRINWSRLVFSDQIQDPTSTGITQTSFAPPGYDNSWYMDVDAGLHLSGVIQEGKITRFGFDLGFAINHIFQPVTSLVNLEASLLRKYSTYTSIIFPIGERKNLATFFNPHFIIERQGDFQNLGAGMKVQFGTKGRLNRIDNKKIIYDRKYFGIMYSARSYFGDYSADIKTLVFSAGFSQYLKDERYQIQAGISWDFPITKIIWDVPGTPEISLAFTIPNYNCNFQSKSRKQTLKNNKPRKGKSRYRGRSPDCPVIGIYF